VRGLVALLMALIFLMPYVASGNFDLALRWVKVDKDVVIEGEIVEVEARVDNVGGVSQAFVVYFYLDYMDEEHLIGTKRYESINSYRLPKIEFDTKGHEGKHEIIAAVFDGNSSNNFAHCSIEILKTKARQNILIEKVYYYAYPNKNNEFISIKNCGGDIKLNGFYLTTHPWKRANKQNKVYLPDILLKNGEELYITQNGSSFLCEMGFNASYEYYDCSPIPDLKREGSFYLPNYGGVVALKDSENHTIDCVVYGNFSYNEGWKGNAIEGKEGYVLQRNGCNDTNTSNDWKLVKIGWSCFPPFHFKARYVKAFCSPDCSYNAVSKALQKAKNISINIYMFAHPYLYKILEESNASIRILLDGNVIGGIPLEERYIAWKLSKKASIRYMFGGKEEKIYKRYRYDHAKYAIIDEKCIIESANWVLSGLPVDESYGNREWGVLIEDKNLSNFLLDVFNNDFNPLMEDSIPFNESDFLKGKPNNFSISFFVPHGNYRKKFDAFELNSSFNATVILAPDNAEEEICGLIDEAEKEILVEQAYIQKEWHGRLNPFLEKLVEKKKEGVKIKVLLNYNPRYKSTNRMNRETKKFLEENGIEVKFSKLNVHNKGMIVDNKVLISSINWGENSVRNNREIGIIIENENVSNYFKKIFYYDWNYGKKKMVGYDFLPILIIILILTMEAKKWRR
jgi:phosphatidylserine/phosphatidylglycerophosphate/cardiolipin synthase-like enzyme